MRDHQFSRNLKEAQRKPNGNLMENHQKPTRKPPRIDQINNGKQCYNAFDCDEQCEAFDQ